MILDACTKADTIPNRNTVYIVLYLCLVLKLNLEFASNKVMRTESDVLHTHPAT